MFEVYSKMYGRSFVPVSYSDDLKMPIENIVAKLNSNVQLLVLVNPNNPMGNVYEDHEMERLLGAAEEREITVLARPPLLTTRLVTSTSSLQERSPNFFRLLVVALDTLLAGRRVLNLFRS